MQKQENTLNENYQKLNKLNELLLNHSSREAEEHILSSLIMNQEKQIKILDSLNAEMFHFVENKTIFSHCKKLYNAGNKIDYTTLLDILQKTGEIKLIGNAIVYVSELMTKYSSDLELKQYFQILRQRYLERAFILQMAKNVTLLESGKDVLEIIEEDNKEKDRLMLSLNSEEQSIKNTMQGLISLMQQVEENRKSNKELSGVPTGMSLFDNHTGGLQEGNLITIAAESSQGKTSLALSWAFNAALRGYAGAYYSLEMGVKELLARVVSMYDAKQQIEGAYSFDFSNSSENITSSSLLYKRLDDGSYNLFLNHCNEIRDLPLFFDERTGSKIDNILRSIKVMKRKYQIRFAVVDYLQILSATSTKENKETELAEITRALKNLAVEEKIPIIILSQLARNKQNPMPTNSRLRGSGQIEEASDMVVLLYRPEVYGLGFSEYGLENENPSGKALVKITKGRNTGMFQFLCSFCKEKTYFY